MEQFYKRLWRVNAPERARTFLWLVSHQVIMTNQERLRRHLSSTDLCQVCKSGTESILHVLRDCPAIEGIWTRILPDRRRNCFFTGSLLEWLYGNLDERDQINDVPWATTFAITVWWAWKWRCANVFGGNKLWRDRVRFIKDRAMEVVKAKEAVESRQHRQEKVEKLVKWNPPRAGWIKLNTDGASHGNPGPATAGGVLRNGDGEWCRGFALNIGRCTAPLAELWGVYYGLCIAWESRPLQVELEVDSEIVVKFLQTGIGEAHPLSFLVRLCHGFFSRDWIVRVTHVYREANRLADGLANYAFSLPFGLHVFDSIPLEVESIVADDTLGQPQVRLVCVE